MLLACEIGARVASIVDLEWEDIQSCGKKMNMVGNLQTC